MRGKGALILAVLLLWAATVDGFDGDAVQNLSCLPCQQVLYLHPNTSGNVDVCAGKNLKIIPQNFSGDPACKWSQGKNPALTINGSYENILPPLSERDTGEYTLEWETTNGIKSSLVIHLNVLNVHKSPTIPKLKLKAPKARGYSVGFLCISSGCPKPTIKWSKDLESDGVKGDVNLDTYNERAESTIKSTKYVSTTVMCCASNTEGKECSQLYDYDMDSDWRPDEEPRRVTLSPGQPLLLRCKTKALKTPIEWDRDSKAINSSTAPCFGNKVEEICIADDRHDSTNMRYLFIDSVTGNHSGTYTCKTQGKTKSVRVQVLAEEFLFVQVENNKTISVRDTPFCLQADVYSHPVLQNCAWEDPENIKTDCGRPTRLWKNSTLKLCHQNKSGEYKLHLKAGRKTETKVMSVCVADESMINCDQNDQNAMNWSCEAISPVPANMTWMSCPANYSCQPESAFWKEIPDTTKEDSDLRCNKKLSSSLAKQNEGHYVRLCLTNSVGTRCSNTIMNEPTKQPQSSALSGSDNGNSTTVLKACSFFLLFALMAVTIVLMYFVKKKKPQYQSQLQMIQMVGPNDNDYIYINFKDFQYDQKWEFPRENLELGKELGSGAFGMVVQATAYGINKPGVSQQVAVKMLKEKHQAEEKEALMSELKMLTHIGHHSNIVNLLGACTGSGPAYLIFQYCCNGDLLNYLKINRDLYHKSLTDAFNKDRFSNLYHNLQPEKSSGEFQRPDGNYVPMYPATTRGQESLALLNLNSTPMDNMTEDPESFMLYEESEDQPEDLHVLTYNDLLSFAYQVARGMDFLSSKNCIHRDLAARNVLVTKGRLVKIADFGLARDIDNDSNYVVKGNVRLPVKWMAPESIFQGMYTMQSDIWAYGILLWEIFSLGVTPYPGVKVDSKFYSMIERGFKMECPYYANESVYGMMCMCWDLEPCNRPPFSKLVSFVDDQLRVMEEKLYHNIPDKNSSDSLYQNAPAVLDISALTKEKDGQSQNQYCQTYATEEIKPQATSHSTAADDECMKPTGSE